MRHIIPMDTSFAEYYGAVELEGILSTIRQSKHACDRLMKVIGIDRGQFAVNKLRNGILTGDLGAEIHDFFLDEIENEAKTVWKGIIYNPDDEDNPDTWFSVGINEYYGVFYVWAIDYDNFGYFLSLEDAKSFAFGNWDNVKDIDE